MRPEVLESTVCRKRSWTLNIHLDATRCRKALWDRERWPQPGRSPRLTNGGVAVVKLELAHSEQHEGYVITGIQSNRTLELRHRHISVICPRGMGRSSSGRELDS